MKKHLLFFLSTFIASVGFAQLSGTYTVNGAQATGGTNYQTFSAAFSALVSSGVSGPVVFNCVQGTYNEQVYHYNSSISGASASNTITFQAAASNTSEVLWQNGSHPLYLYYGTYTNVTFDGIHFKTTGTTSNAIRLYYGTFTNWTFENCIIEAPVGSSTSTSYAAFYSYFATQNNLTLQDNEIKGGSIGTYVYYSNYGSSSNSKVSILDNDIEDFSYMGMYLYGQYSNYTEYDLKGNTITNNPSGYSYPYGIYCYFSRSGTEITGNYISLDAASGGYGLLVNYSYGTSSSPNLVNNNIVIFPDQNDPYNQYGLQASYNYYTEINHNTISVSNSYTNTFGAYLYYSSSSYVGNEFRNNIISTKSSSARNLYTYYLGSSSNTMDFSNNAYYAASGSEVNIYNAYTGTQYSTLGSWQTASGSDANSVVSNPVFISSTNMTPQSISINDNGTPVGVTTDFYGQSRSTTTPDPGAIEFIVPTNNAQPSDVLNPSAPLCDEDTSLIVVISNTGIANLTSLNIQYTVNNGTATTYNWTGNLASQAMDTVTVLSPTSYSNGDVVKVWTALPNGVLDSASQFDTIIVSLTSGLSGTYTIPGDYASLTAARDALVAAGICDDVVFNIGAGTYNEQVSFPDIAGTSEDATITFQSATGNVNSVTITNSSYPTLSFDGADWITFKNLKITNSSGNVIQVPGSSDHVTIENNWIKGIAGTSTFTQSLINVQGMPSNLSIENNTLEKGSAWFYSTSGSGTAMKADLSIMGNTMKDQSYYGAYIYYFDGVEFHENHIVNDSAFQYGFGYYGMGYWYNCSDFNITKNYLGANTSNGWYYGLYMYNCIGTSNPRSQIANNCLITGNATSSNAYYALYLSQSGLVDVFNNSVVRSANNNSYSAYISQGGAISLKNNSFSNTGSGYAFAVDGSFAINESDYNNFYTPSGPVVYFGGSAYNTLQDYQEATGNDEHSVITAPNWEDLMACVTCNDTLNNAGVVLATLTDDINGNARSVLHPDIGAVEFVSPLSFTLGGDDTICGNEHILEAGPAQSITWNVNNQTSSNASVLLEASGIPSTFTVSVNITTEYCGSGSDNAVIRLVPDATLDATLHLCADESETLQPGGSASADFLWSTGETSNTIEVSEPGTYHVTKIEEGCQSDATIEVSQSDAVNITDMDACSDDMPLEVNATIANGTSYAWSGGASINTAINSLSDGGDYSVTATDSYGCTSSSEFSLMVLEEPTATITEYHSGNAYFFDGTSSLYVSSNTSYFWDLGYNGITDTSSSPMISYPWSDPSNLTTYTVSLTVDNGCGVDFTTMEVTPDPVGTEEISKIEMEAYPNPTAENVWIKFSIPVAVEMEVVLQDVLGKVLSKQLILPGQQQLELNLSDLPAGVYQAVINTDETTDVVNIIKH